MHGWLNLNKPVGISSAKAVAIAKGALRHATGGKVKVGHAGTLDPLASGVLPIAIGEATKTQDYMMDAVKGYDFTLTFGKATTTDDAEGETTQTSNERPFKNNIIELLDMFIGGIKQVPPAYSALKVDGKRAYALARAGEEVVLKPRQVTIHSLELINTRHSEQPVGLEESAEIPRRPNGFARDDELVETASFNCTCSKGTYIRSLARDIALAAGSVGHVSRLTRTQVGNFLLKDSISLDFLENLVHNAPSDAAAALSDCLLPVNTVLDDILALAIDETQETQLRHGQMINVEMPESREIIAAMRGDKLVALCVRQGTQLKSKRVFNL